MTRDDIIRMAREAGAGEPESLYGRTDYAVMTKHELERFAALIAAAERNRKWTQDHWTEYERSIASAEREACAKVCEEDGLLWGQRYAAAIRARGEK
jgi:hypothetical protein